jgi:hypothetical protein
VATHRNHKYLVATFNFWYDKSNDNIHITSNDPDFKPDGMHVSVKKGTASDRTARAALARYGCPHSPAWKEIEGRRKTATALVLGMALIPKADGQERTLEDLLAAYQAGEIENWEAEIQDRIERLVAADSLNWRQLERIMQAKTLEELSEAGAYQDDDDTT